MRPSFDEELVLWQSDIDYVIGIDEVGRGAFAGPIVAAGVVFSPNIDQNLLSEINDSKQVKPLLRKKCAEIIKQNSIYWCIEQIDVRFINRYGIGKANSAVFRKILRSFIANVGKDNYFVLMDGFHKKYLPGGIDKQRGIVKGDQKSLSIAAASILAKVHRDKLMKGVSKTYPEYKFGSNKGYGTRDHQQAIKEFGLTEIHRKSFNLAKFATI